MDSLLLALGFGLLLGGGDALVRGSTALARRVGVSPFAIGLTLVAFGTSAPELGVNLTAAYLGRTDISFGNIIGSNMANIGLVIGATAILRPVGVHATVVVRELPMMLLATAAIGAMASDRLLGNGFDEIGRGDGLVLLLLFVLFLYYAVGDMVRQRSANGAHDPQPLIAARSPSRLDAPGTSLAIAFLGLVALLGGAQVAVDSAVNIARALHVSEAIIGLTVLAVGTSLPELAASGIAMWRGNSELAIGNVVGSNIFNILLVAGASAVVHPIPLPLGGGADLLFLGTLSVFLVLASITFGNRILRREGVLLLLAYCGYMVWRTAGPG